MIIEKKKISDLIPAPYNPRQSTAKQEKHLKESLEKFGLVEPIIFNKQTGYIVGGHFRVRELKKLGIKEIECVIVDLNEEDEKELNIRLNANTGSWDWDTLANDWDVVDLEAWGLEIPQFDTVEELEASEDDYEVPEGGIETDIVIGDLFEIGEHRLLCGDSTDSELLQKLLQGKKPELLLTDPPYGIGYAGSMQLGQEKHGWKQYEGGWDESKPESGVLQYLCQITENQIIWGGNYFTDDLPPTMGWLIWDKGQRGFSLADGEMAWTSFNNALRIKEYARAKANQEEKNHPTQKPQEIIQWCFEYADRHTKNKIKLVLDPYLGSGSTMVAAHQLKRKCYGLELEPKYCQVIIDRMRKLDSSLIIKRNGVELKQA
jgi:DNA modification methylase